MSDASQAPDESGTPEPQPAVAAPEAPSADTVDYAKRYEDARTELNRQATFLDRLRNGDPEAIAEIGLEVYQEPEPEPAPQGEFDPFDPDSLQALVDARVRDQVEQALAPIQEEQRREKIELASVAALHAIPGFDELTERQQNTVWNLAKTGTTPDGLYDVQGAWDTLTGAIDDGITHWSKKKPQGARVAGGQAATDVPPNEDASIQELTKWAQEQMQIRGE